MKKKKCENCEIGDGIHVKFRDFTGETGRDGEEMWMCLECIQAVSRPLKVHTDRKFILIDDSQ